MNQINELQIFSARLLGALEKLDMAKGKDACKETTKTLKSLVSSFDKTRQDYENIFSQTRHLYNPEGYQLDMNIHHHIANSSNTNDWMFMYELLLIEEINKMLKDK